MNRGVRTALTAVAWALLAGPIALGFLAEARNSRALALLEEIRAAEEHLAYQGRRTIRTREPDGVHSRKIDVRVEPGRRIRVRPAPGEPARARRGWNPLRRRTRARISDPELILENYHVAWGEAGHVAGREVDWIRLEAKHPNRASYELAVDRQLRLPLAFRALDVQGQTMYESRFESLTLDVPPLSEEHKPATEAEAPKRPRPFRSIERESVSENDIRGVMTFTTWKPSRLPAGYRFKSLELLRIPGSGEALIGLWSDGMTTMSLVQASSVNPSWRFFRGLIGLEDAAREPSETVEVRRLSHPAGGTVLDTTLGGTDVLIAGQIDSAELENVVRYLVKME
ncbi:MAG: hypothetical protein HY716_15100 [Planctomycetes bacterium]|nr:hypothetical protein [Planctomycetota bacterium]